MRKCVKCYHIYLLQTIWLLSQNSFSLNASCTLFFYGYFNWLNYRFLSVPQHRRGENEATMRSSRKGTANLRTNCIIQPAFCRDILSRWMVFSIEMETKIDWSNLLLIRGRFSLVLYYHQTGLQRWNLTSYFTVRGG